MANSKALDFLNKVAETNYPPKTYFTGGYMPEAEEADGDNPIPTPKKPKKKKAEGMEKAVAFTEHVEECLGEDFVEAIWSKDVDTKKHPPEGTFTKGADDVAAWLKKSHKTLKSAVAALNFYRNRNPDNMSKDKHDEILGKLHTAYGAA